MIYDCCYDLCSPKVTHMLYVSRENKNVFADLFLGLRSMTFY